MIVQTSKGEKITLADTALSSGGEGEVRMIVSPAHLRANCVKIYYLQKRSQQQADKIRFMVNNPPKIVENNGFKIGWPLDTILQNNQFIGFMMPLAFSDSKKLVTLTTPKINKNLDSSWHNKYDRNLGKYALISRLKLMNNIAIPVHLLHATGKYVLQDFKPDNVLITHSGQVTICDMDSIQIINGQSMLFRGTAATPGYAPPEFENNGVGKSPTIPLNKSWDNFALSVVFYQLLFGLHPYAVTPKMQKDANSSEISTNISDDLFPFGNNVSKIQVIPPLHNKFNILPQQIQNLFKRSFSTDCNQRPAAEEWGKNIHEIIASAGVVTPPPQPQPPTPTPQQRPQPPTPQPRPPRVRKKRKKWWIWLIVIVGIIIFIAIISSAYKSKNSYDQIENIRPVNTNSSTNYEEKTEDMPVYEEAEYVQEMSISNYVSTATVNTSGSFPDNLLRIRATPNTDQTNSNFVIAVIIGETVEILEKNVKQDYINGESGYWVKVRYSGIGWDKKAKNCYNGTWEGYAWENYLKY